MGVTVVETSNGFDSMIGADQSRNAAGRQSVMLPPGGAFAAGSFDNSL